MPHLSSDHIKREIGDTRREIDETIDEIGERLHPRHLLDDLIAVVRSRFSGDGVGTAGSKVTHTSKRFGRTLGHQLREHPVPALLMGAGVTWWLWDAATDDEDEDVFYAHPEDEEPESYYADTATGPMAVEADEESAKGLGERAGEKAAAAKARVGSASDAVAGKLSDTGEAASHALSRTRSAVSEKLGSAGASVQSAASSTWDSARRRGRRISRGSRRLSHKFGDEIRDGIAEASEGYHYARGRFEDAVEDYPIAVGAAALAAGMLLGALIPRSRYEDEWMGSASDELKSSARDLGEEAAGKAHEVASRTVQSAADQAEQQGLTPEQLGDKLKKVASNLGDAAKETAREEGLSPSQLKEKASRVVEEAEAIAREEGEKAADNLEQKARRRD